MNKETFKSILEPEMGANNVATTDDAARILSDAYDYANIGNTCTFFGSMVASGDKATLKDLIKTGFDLNRATGGDEGYILIATGFCLYWVKSTFTQLPPMPPTTVPLAGTMVLFPGNPKDLEKEIKLAFSQGDFNLFVDSLYTALVGHQTTIAGTYNGLVPSVPAPIAVTLPWLGLLSVPPPSGSGLSGSAAIEDELKSKAGEKLEELKDLVEDAVKKAAEGGTKETLKGTLDDVIGKVGELGKSVATNSSTTITQSADASILPTNQPSTNNFSG